MKLHKIIEAHEIENPLGNVERMTWNEADNGLSREARLAEARRGLLLLRTVWDLLTARVRFALGRAQLAVDELEHEGKR